MRLERLRRVTGEELRWRASVAARTSAQRAAARLRPPRWNRDALYRVLREDAHGDPHARAGQHDWQAVHEALAARLRGRPGRFLLDPASADALRTRILATWPAAGTDAAERADAILHGRYDLLGYRALSFARGGHAIDWHFDPVHDRQMPVAFWAGVPYLDPANGDHKVIWEINRHQHWMQLGRALWLTRDARYGDAIVGQLESWLGANPPLIGTNWASMLELGFRALSWTWALHMLLADAAPAESARRTPWLVDMLIGIDRQLTHVEQNLSHYFSPNTHLTGEALALYVVGTALPELTASARWVETGRRILLAEIDRQILADGGHAERSTHYQRYTLDFYLLALLTARRANDTAAIPRLAGAAVRLAEFTCTLADDEGRLPLIGDDDGGTLWRFTERRCNDVRDSLAVAAVVLDRPDLARWGLTEEALWLAGPAADIVPDAPHARGSLASRAFTDTGYIVLRDRQGGHGVFDAGAHGYMNAGHAHADALAITLGLAHRPLLVDPGTATYTVDPDLRDRMRSSMSHNTLVVGNRSQSIPSGPFHWQTRADAQLHGFRHNVGFDWVEASHDGYAPIRHRRTLLRAGSGWLVADELVGDGAVAASAHWHFAPDWAVTQDGAGRLRAVHADGTVAWLLHDGGAASLHRGDEQSGLGWHAPVYGMLVPAWTARVRCEGSAPLTLVTWIAAMGSEAGPPSLERVVPKCSGGSAAIAAVATDAGGRSVFLLRPGREAAGGACDVLAYRTDARVLHYRSEGDRLLVLDLVDATQVHSLREGWPGISSDAAISDLHLSMREGVIDLRTTRPPSRIQLHGKATTPARVDLNGRAWRPARAGENSLVITRSDWAATDSEPQQ